jgi:hypothetical protein
VTAGTTPLGYREEMGMEATDAEVSKNLGSLVGNSPSASRFPPLRYMSLPLPTSVATALVSPAHLL